MFCCTEEAAKMMGLDVGVSSEPAAAAPQASPCGCHSAKREACAKACGVGALFVLGVLLGIALS